MNRLVKKFFSALITVMLVVTTIGSIPSKVSATTARRCEPKATGSFVQSWMCNSWNDSRWEAELDAMDSAGITYLVLSDVASKAKNSDGGKWSTYYPSQLPELSGANLQAYYGDVIEKALRNCQQHNVKVFIGMGMYEDFWINGGIGSTYSDFCNVSAKIAEEIYGMYYSRYPGTFYGWYFVPEFNNNYLNMTPFASTFAQGLNVILNKLTQVNPGLPMMMSPYYMEYYTTANLNDTKSFWQSFFAQTNFRPGDIFSPQDAVGAGWVQFSNLAAITQMYREVVDGANKGVILWSNCENFTQNHDGGLLGPPKTENTTFITSPLNRFVQQMDVVSQYVDNIITFSYNHYYSPEYLNPVYNNTYLNYLQNSYVLEMQKPVAPTRVETALQIDNSLLISWNSAVDNIGIAAYRVYKNGSFMVRNDVHGSSVDQFCSDTGFSTSGLTTYEIEAIDGAGNTSERIKIIVDGQYPNSYVDYSPAEKYKCIANIENISAGIRPGVNDTSGYFSNLAGNGQNFLVETVDGTGYQGSRGLRYSVPPSANADAWVSFQMLPPAYNSAQAKGATDLYFWIDTTSLGSQRFSHMLYFSENDTAGNESTIWTLQSSGYFYIENGRGGFIKIPIDNSYLKYPAGYKGFVKVPLSSFTPTWATSDSNSQFGLDGINYILLAFNSFDEWHGYNVTFDSFGFTGNIVDGVNPPTEYNKYSFKNVSSFETIPAGTRPGVNDSTGYFNTITGNGQNYLLEVVSGAGYKGGKGLKYSVPSNASANVWVSLQMLPPSFGTQEATGAKELYFWIDTTDFIDSFSHQLYFSEYDAAASETTAWGLNSSGDFYIENATGGFVKKQINNGSLAYPSGYKGYVKVPFPSMSPQWSTSNTNGQVGLNSIHYLWIAFNSWKSDYNESVSFDNFGFNGVFTDGVRLPTQY